MPTDVWGANTGQRSPTIKLPGERRYKQAMRRAFGTEAAEIRKLKGRGAPSLPSSDTSAKRARRLLLCNEIPKRFEQHVLLGSPEIDLQLLKCNKNRIARVEISPHVQLCMTAGCAHSPRDAHDLGWCRGFRLRYRFR